MFKHTTRLKYSVYLNNKLIKKYSNHANVFRLVNDIYQYEISQSSNFTKVKDLIKGKFYFDRPSTGHLFRTAYVKALGYVIVKHEKILL